MEATNIFSGTTYPTSNLYLTEVWKIRDVLLDGIADVDETISSVSVEMYKKFQKYWDEFNMIFVIATVLDPKKKLLLVQFCFDKVYGTEVSKKKVDDARELLKKFFDAYATTPRSPFSTPSSTYVGSQEQSSSQVTSNKRKFQDAFAQYRATFSKKSKKSEMDAYLEEDLVEEMEDDTFDVLNWWNTHKNSYPTLAKIARDVLAIPASTVSSESAFSTSGRVIDQYRSSLGPTTVEALVCAGDWLKVHKGEGKYVAKH